MKQRSENKKRNEQEIIHAAFDLFVTKGLGNTTIGDIVENTSLARGTFYNYFRSREEIWFNITEKLFVEIQEVAKVGRKKSRNLYDYIQNGLYSAILICNTPPYPGLIAKNQVEFRDLLENNEMVSSILIDYEREMRERGFLDDIPESFLKMTFYAISGSAHEIIIQSHRHGDKLSAQQITDFVMNIFVKSVEEVNKKG